MGRTYITGRTQHTANGIVTIFDTTDGFVADSTLVFVNGILSKKGTEYIEGSNLKSIEFILPPENLYEIEIIYLKSSGVTIPAAQSNDELENILTGKAILRRLTPNVVDKTASIASLAVNRQPAQSCRLAIDVEGATIATGSVAFAGSTNETINFTSNSVEVSAKDFTSISTITVAGISNGFITVRAVSKMGQPVNQEKTIDYDLPVRFFAKSGKIRMLAVGQENKISRYSFMVSPDADIQENDILYAVSQVQLDKSQVNFVETIYDFDGITHHIEADVKEG